MEEKLNNEIRLKENRQVWDQEKEVNKRKEKNIKSNPTLRLSNIEIKIPMVIVRKKIYKKINNQKIQNVLSNHPLKISLQ